MAMTNGKTINRRVAFRIYEQTNILYQKIHRHRIEEQGADFDKILQGPAQYESTPQTASVEQRLPDSRSRENDTLNANISSSGIAFTCQEELDAGDYLMIRILMLSSMTAITTCCKVVYCKPSNPYETDRYPYLIGARFVNLTGKDKELLDSFVKKRKKQQRISYGLLLSLAMIVLAMPHLVFELLLELVHHVLEIVLHLLHLGFEFIEYNLDHLIEHTLHTDLHTTQVTVFYILVSLGLAGLYWLWRIIPPVWRNFMRHQTAFWGRKKSSFLYFWGGQTLSNKIRIIGASVAVIAGYAYFGI